MFCCGVVSLGGSGQFFLFGDVDSIGLTFPNFLPCTVCHSPVLTFVQVISGVDIASALKLI